MPDTLQPILAWMTIHPSLTSLLIFLTAFFESLILIGILIPGALIMFGLGALVTTGHISLSNLLIFGSLGAIAGDCFSFWLGRHFKSHLLDMWPFKRYPTLIDKGRIFINNHGGKGIFMARFIGPIRPVVPAVAGILNMPTKKFVAIDIIAGILWTPAYVLPGAAFGASLTLASEVAMRLVILLMTGIVTLWLLQWGCKKTVQFIHGHAHEWLETLQQWGYKHQYMSKPISAVLDPNHPEIKGILSLALLLFIASWSALFALIYFVDSHEIIRFNAQIQQLLKQLKTPATDGLMLFVQLFSSQVILFSLFCTVSLWLAWKRYWFPLFHWLAAISFGLLLAASLRWLIATEFLGFSLEHLNIHPPSSQITDMIAILGFFAVFIAHKMPLQHRWIPYSAAAFWVILVIVSKLYLGSLGILGILGGLAFGIAWLVLISTAYRTHIQEPIPTKSLLGLFVMTWIITGAYNIQTHWADDFSKINPIQKYNTVSFHHWKNQGWKKLPHQRIDLTQKGSEALTIQWADNAIIINQKLKQQGWIKPTPLTIISSLLWLSADSQEVPLLPKVHDGHHEAIIFIKKHAGYKLVLRLWATQEKIQSESQRLPLWVGNISRYSMTHPLPILSIPETTLFKVDTPSLLAGKLILKGSTTLISSLNK